MTEPANDWLIMKRNLYFRPDAKGYTGIRDEAGRYSYEEALKYNDCHFIREADAPEFTEAAFNDLVIKHLVKQRDEAREEAAGLRARLESLTRDDIEEPRP